MMGLTSTKIVIRQLNADLRITVTLEELYD